MPPPMEKAMIENPPEAVPVHDSGDEAIAKKTCRMKSLASWDTSRGASE